MSILEVMYHKDNSLILLDTICNRNSESLLIVYIDQPFPKEGGEKEP